MATVKIIPRAQEPPYIPIKIEDVDAVMFVNGETWGTPKPDGAAENLVYINPEHVISVSVKA